MTHHRPPLAKYWLRWTLMLLIAGICQRPSISTATSDESASAFTTADEIRAQAEAAVARLAQQAKLKVIASAGPLDARLRLQRCSRALQSTVNDDWQSSDFTTVRLQCAAPVRWSIYVRVALRTERTVLVALRTLPRGSVLQESDFASQVKVVNGSTAHYVGEPGTVAGLRLRLPLRAGDALSSDAVEQLPLIRRGQQITLVARAEGLEIRVAATAMSDGRRLERIMVQNQSTHRQVEAVVRSSELVEVGL